MPAKAKKTGYAIIRRRVFVSMVADRLLTKTQNMFKWSVVEHIEKGGYEAEIFYNPRTTEGIAARKSWTPVEAEEVIRRCIGGVIIGQPRWNFANKRLATEYAQYEAAILKTVSLPLMVLVQDDVQQRGIFEYNFG